MKQIMMILLLLIATKFNYSEPVSDLSFYKERLLYEQKYLETLEFIKKHEGFRDSVYEDTNGYKTIGYGFRTDYLHSNQDTITIQEADSILNQKMLSNIDIVKKEYPDLNKFQILAIAHLVYAKGFSTLKNHPLHKEIKNNNVNKNTWIYFSRYEKNNKRYRCNREFEYELFNLEI